MRQPSVDQIDGSGSRGIVLHRCSIKDRLTGQPEPSATANRQVETTGIDLLRFGCAAKLTFGRQSLTSA